MTLSVQSLLPVAALCLWGGTTIAARAEPLEVAVERSEAFAEEALSLIRTGHRLEAMAEALKGIPVDPGPDIEADFAAAHDALARALASRIVVSDTAGANQFTVSPLGDRAVSGGHGSVALGYTDAAPFVLHRMPGGEVIAELGPWDLAVTDVWGPGLPPAVSPGGTEFALWKMSTGEIVRFAAKDGAPLPSLSGIGGGQNRPGYLIGYSADGSRIAAEHDDVIGIWEFATGALLDRTEVPREQWGTRWSHDGTLIGLRIPNVDDPGGPAGLFRLVDGEWVEVLDLTGRIEGLDYYLTLSQSGPQAIVHNAADGFLVDYEAGTIVPAGPINMAVPRLVRGGTAAATLKPSGFMGLGPLRLSVVALDGRPLEARWSDWVVFDQYVTGGEAAPDNYPPFRPYAYRGADLPEGPELVAAAESELGAETLAQIATERVAPD